MNRLFFTLRAWPIDSSGSFPTIRQFRFDFIAVIEEGASKPAFIFFLGLLASLFNLFSHHFVTLFCMLPGIFIPTTDTFNAITLLTLNLVNMNMEPVSYRLYACTVYDGRKIYPMCKILVHTIRLIIIYHQKRYQVKRYLHPTP